MTHLRNPLFSTLLLLALFALLLSALEGERTVPESSVALVGEREIKRTEFQHWLRVAALSKAAQEQGEQPNGPVNVPQPPFEQCVRFRLQNPAPQPRGQAKPSRAQLLLNCRTEYELLRGQVMKFLLSSAWVEEEAADQGERVSARQVRRDFEKIKKESFSNDAQYQQFLRSSGMTEEDLLSRGRTEALSNQIRDKILRNTQPSGEKQVREYYRKNRKRFALPERRDLRMILTTSRARGNAARRFLKAGGSWKAASKRFGQPISPQGDGVVKGLSRGQQEKALDQVAFSSKPGVLRGPVEGQFGFYLLQVQKIIPAKQQSLAVSHKAIRQLLKTEQNDRAIAEYTARFTRKWKGQTLCAPAYRVEDCKNAPPPKPQPAPGAPQGPQEPLPAP